MSNAEPNDLEDLVEYLARTTRLERREAERLIDEVLSFLGEQPETFVRRRHLELQRQGLANEAIFARLEQELARRRFAAPAYTTAATAPHRLRLGASPMCGIVGYIGKRQAAPILLEGLQRLEYRGYDSAGHRGRQRGQAQASPSARARCASSTRSSRTNVPRRSGHRPHPLGDPRRAHRPQRPSPRDATGAYAVVHNGIVENCRGAARRSSTRAAASSRRRPTPRCWRT